MVRIFKNGETVRDYQIVGSPLNRGAFAVAYKANREGETVFFKQYKSPVASVDWFDAYLKHLLKMKNRIETTPVLNATYRFVDVFAEKGVLYQVFEFIPNQKDLADFLFEFKHDKSAATWAKRVIFAKLLMNGMKIFHKENIIHSDMKPENVVLIQAPEIATGYRFKIADLDFSFMSDSPVPWREALGFVGTPGYFSPEHMRGEQPTAASDVFTCGIILHEILCDTHPYVTEDAGEYKTRVEAWSLKPPVLLGEFPGGITEDVSIMIRRMLNPNPKCRPTAEEVHALLLSKKRVVSGKPVPKAPTREALGKPAVPAKPGAVAASSEIILKSAENTLRASITTPLGSGALQILGSDARFASSLQFTLLKEAGGWYILPNLEATNETILNRAILTKKTRLNAGDEISIGRLAKGTFKLPMKVEFPSK